VPNATGGRPQLLSGLRPLWRGQSSIQLGRDPDRSVVVEGVDEASARLLVGLDGRRSEAQVLADAATDGLDTAVVTRLLTGLRRCGLVVDAESALLSELGGPDIAERLEPDHASLTLASPQRGAAGTLRQRQRRTVAVHGAGRIGAPTAALLAASGVGRLAILDQHRSRPCDAAPGGIMPQDAYQPRAEAATAAVRRAAPEAEVGPLHPGQLPDVAVLTDPEPVEPELRRVLHRMRVPHLRVHIRETAAVVGPLVLPGISSCLTCADLHRRDRDPAWPVLATQLTVPRRRQREPADVVLASQAAAITALQVLALLDGDDPATLDGTLEVRLPDWRVRRRTWPPHPSCPCGASQPSARRLAG